MRITPITRGRRPASDIAGAMAERIIGQPAAMHGIVPFIRMHQAGLGPEGRPAGVFLLLGPTGTGKTRTVEALAEVLHGTPRHLLRVDCGEFQMDHEVAKLIGAPPGYLGHRETHPILTQQRLLAVTSERSPLSLVLFDEIEKAAPSMTRILLGLLDKGTLRLGDNTNVNFEHSLIFLTSNLGARQMMKELNPSFGFHLGVQAPVADLSHKLERIATTAVRRRFSPEFVNRIDNVITYQPLTAAALSEILEIELENLGKLVGSRLGPRAFGLELTRGARAFLLSQGASPEFGARELKRTLQRLVIQPVAEMVAEGKVPGGSVLRVDEASGCLKMRITRRPRELRPAC
jgi:ATP-dependent Clp protease ATP-binding subunit ClpA